MRVDAVLIPVVFDHLGIHLPLVSDGAVLVVIEEVALDDISDRALAAPVGKVYPSLEAGVGLLVTGMVEGVAVDAVMVGMILAGRAGDDLEPAAAGMVEQVEAEEVIWGSQCQPRGSGKTKAIALVEVVASHRTLGDRAAVSLESPIGGIGLVVKVVVPDHVILAVDAQRVMTRRRQIYCLR